MSLDSEFWKGYYDIDPSEAEHAKKSLEGIETIQELFGVLTERQQINLDAALNVIDESRKSLELADDQMAVLEVLKDIVTRSIASEAEEIAKKRLAQLL